MTINVPEDRVVDRREFEARRGFIMAVLNGLHMDFEALGLLSQAGPHLHQLLALAYHAQLEPGAARARSSEIEIGSRNSEADD